MTEEQFDKRVEVAAARFERRVENMAAHLDTKVTRSYRKNRKIFKIVQWVVALWLLQGFWLFPGTAGMICGWLGVAGLIGAVVQAFLFR